LPYWGVLTDAVELGESGTGYRRYRPRGEFYWGTPELVSMLQDAAARVAEASPGSPPLIVGDLSARRGGRIERHQSHRTGRDVDLLFYVTTPAGAALASPGFVKFGQDGLGETGSRPPFLRFDVARNWLLVKALLTSPAASVQRIYVARPLEALLTDYARARETDLALLVRAELVLAQPSDSSPHDDHFHLRIACTPERAVAGCDGGGPQWEWLPMASELGFGEGDLPVLLDGLDSTGGQSAAHSLPSGWYQDDRRESRRAIFHDVVK
jgi:penicillin-insensitive murein DD-endopeptidase